MAFIGSLITTVKANTAPLKKSLNSAGKDVSKFKMSIQNAVGTVSKFAFVLGTAVVGAAVAAGVALVNLASDFQEASQKFGVIFGNVGKQSKKMRDELVKNFGLSTTAATTLLAATGDLLTGFGMTDEAALKMSSDVQKLSVDLASFNNTQGGAERVSKILTKALLGQRDGLTELGIGILDADVKLRLAEKGQSKLEGTAKRVAISYATMELAMEQTTKAQGDFARSGGSLENVMKKISAKADDLGVAIGEMFLGPATALAETFLFTLENIAPAISLIGTAANIATTSMSGLFNIVKDVAKLFTIDKDTPNYQDDTTIYTDRSIGQRLKREEEQRATTRATALRGLKEEAKEVERLAQLRRMTVAKHAEAQWKTARAIEAKTKAEQEYQKVLSMANSIFAETRTPFEAVEIKLKSLIDMLNKKGLTAGLKEGIIRKIADLQKIKQEILLGDKITQAKDDNATIENLRNKFMTPIDKVMAEMNRLEDQKRRGGFEGEEDLFQQAMRDIISQAEAIDIDEMAKKKQKKIDDAGTFKELDLKNVDIAGLTGKENVDKKTLSENEKQTKLLKQIADKDDQKVPVAV